MKEYLALFSITAFLSLSNLLSAQNVINDYIIEPIIYDFGVVSDNQGPITCSFNVENIGDNTFFIQDVTASCGCTKTTWTKKPILPGGKGRITAVYSNNEGPYPFDKSLLVKISCKNDPIVLHLRGNVVHQNDKPLKEYKYRIGSIGLKEEEYNLGCLHKDSIYNGKLPLYNFAKDSISFEIISLNQSISITEINGRIPPHSHFQVSYLIKPTTTSKYGAQTDSIVFISRTEKKTEKKDVLFNYCIYPYSSIDKRPIALISEEHIALGTVNRKTIRNISVKIANIGTDVLEIYDIETPPNIIVNIDSTTIPPGKEIEIFGTVSFKSIKKKEGVAMISIYTDSLYKTVHHTYITYNRNRLSICYERIKDKVRMLFQSAPLTRRRMEHK